MEQLHKIYKLCGSPSDEYWKKSKLPNATSFKPRDPYKRHIRETFKDFPPSALPLIDTLLAIDPVERKTASDALRSEVGFSKFQIFLSLKCWCDALRFCTAFLLVLLFHSHTTLTDLFHSHTYLKVFFVRCMNKLG